MNQTRLEKMTKNSHNISGVTERLRQICKSKFGDSSPKMAEALGLSQPGVWRVLAGKQLPSGVFLAALSKFEDIDLNWLYRGNGDSPEAEQGQEFRLPISGELLNSSLSTCRQQLTDRTLIVSSADYRPSRYLLEVQPHELITRSEEVKVDPRDLLLMETDRRRFPSETRLSGICGVRTQAEAGPECRLALVQHVAADPEEGDAHLEANAFDPVVGDTELIRRHVIVERPGKSPLVQTQLFTMSKTGREVPVSDLQLDPVPFRVAYSDVVSVCVLLMRRRFPVG